MERLTKREGKHTVRVRNEWRRHDPVWDKLANYEDLEERIEKLFDGKISLAEAVDNIEKKVHGEENFRYSRILTNAEAEKWDKWLELEKQGRLIELPCKVGDTVYILGQYFSCGKYEILIGFFDTVDVILENKENFGKTVFLTKEEAEAKLKEMVGANNDR